MKCDASVTYKLAGYFMVCDEYDGGECSRNTNYKLNGCDDAIDEAPKEVNTKWKITSLNELN